MSAIAECRAIFLDRDGTINEDSEAYVKSWAEFRFLPGSLSALRRLSALPVLVIVVTNQSAIGRGLTTAGAVNDLHRRMLAQVRQAGGRIDAVYLCPHTPEEGCGCRKPRPGMLLRARREHRVSLSRSFLVGDRRSDLLAAREVGCHPVLVGEELGKEPPASVPTFPGLHGAVSFLVARLEAGRDPAASG